MKQDMVQKIEQTKHICAYSKGVHKIKDCPKRNEVVQFILRHRLEEIL